MKKIIMIAAMVAAMAPAMGAQNVQDVQGQNVDEEKVITYRGGQLVSPGGMVITKEMGQEYFQGVQYEDFLRASRKIKTANVLTEIGACFVGFAIGYPIGGMIGGADIKSDLKISAICLACSVPFLSVGFPLDQSGKKALKGLAEDYNEAQKRQANRPMLHVGGTRSGFGLALNF